MAIEDMAQIKKSELWTIPNIITYFRILCIPAYIALATVAGLRADTTLWYVSLAIFIIAAASDLVDGYLARRFNWVSGVGKVLDPLADKLMHVSMVFCLAFIPPFTALGGGAVGSAGVWYVHYAFVICMLLKEGLQIALAPIVMKMGAVLQANMLGKVGSFTISVGVILAFFHPLVAYADWGILGWGICISYAALGSYVKDVIDQLKAKKKAAAAAAEQSDDAQKQDIADKDTEDK